MPRHQEDPTVKRWVGGGAADAKELDPEGGEQSPGASATPATTEVGSASAGPQVEKEAAQVLGQVHGEVTPPHTGSGTLLAAPLRLKFPLRGSGG